jgi:hypothetical protein
VLTDRPSGVLKYDLYGDFLTQWFGRNDEYGSGMYSSIAAFRGTQVVQGDTDRSRESYPNSYVYVAWRYLPINQPQRYLPNIDI